MNEGFIIKYLCSKHEIFKGYVDDYYDTVERQRYITMRIFKNENVLSVIIVNEQEDVNYNNGKDFNFEIQLWDIIEYISELFEKISDVVKF